MGINIPEEEENDDEEEGGGSSKWCCSYRAFSDGIIDSWKGIKSVVSMAWEFGRSDPRKVVYSAKVGLGLMLLSLLIFLKEPFNGMSQYCVWSIMTVVVVFEFSIGMAPLLLFCFMGFFLSVGPFIYNYILFV